MKRQIWGQVLGFMVKSLARMPNPTSECQGFVPGPGSQLPLMNGLATNAGPGREQWWPKWLDSCHTLRRPGLSFWLLGHLESRLTDGRIPSIPFSSVSACQTTTQIIKKATVFCCWSKNAGHSSLQGYTFCEHTSLPRFVHHLCPIPAFILLVHSDLNHHNQSISCLYCRWLS